jgi:nucleotide-binding universal stress UspA family protein
MYRKILAGTDGSDSATLALAHAADLAERVSAELLVATAHSSERSSDPGSVIAGALLRDVQSAYGDRIRVSTKAVSGNAADVLLDLAETERCDLVVVGNRGLAGSAMLQPASIPGRVSKRSPVAVLVADTMGKQQPGYQRILVGTDGSATSVTAVETASELAAALGAEVALATAASSDRDGRRTLDALRARWPDHPVHLMTGEPAETLSDLAESERYDLLVLGNKGMAGVRRALGSIPLRVLRRAPASVLIVNTTG